MRRKLPFGIAQIGRTFRNEITPGNFIFRLREFEQMEMEFFVHPRDEDEWFAYWVDARHRWWTDVLGIGAERLRLRPHDADELSHYSKQTTDIEYEFPIGWSELEGVADRTDFDLGRTPPAAARSSRSSTRRRGEHIVPYVIEPAMGVDRAVLTVLVDGYTEEQLAKETRVVLRIRPELAPIKAAVLPLLRNRPELVERARRLTADLKPLLAATYDDTASIGKLYRRQDEIGTPFCVTVDVESLDDGAATIRERDSMTQERVALELHPAARRRPRCRAGRRGRAYRARPPRRDRPIRARSRDRAARPVARRIRRRRRRCLRRLLRRGRAALPPSPPGRHRA